MKDYSMNQTEKDKFITDIRKVSTEDGNEEYEVLFADGEVFTGIEVCEENLSKIEEQMKKQANAGVARFSSFVKRKSKAVGAIVFGSAATLSSATMLATGFISAEPNIVLQTALGVVGVFSLIKGSKVYLNVAPKVKELKKIKYLDNHKKTLENYYEYPNALEGLDSYTREYFEEEENPFSMINIDEYDKEDLENIMKNINREREFGFTYNK